MLKVNESTCYFNLLKGHKMGRYDQIKSKKSGRYNTIQTKKSSRVNIAAVIMLMILAAMGGFYFATELTRSELTQETRALGLPAAKDKESDEPGFSPADPALDKIEELQQQEQWVLPSLDSSDEWVREALIQASPGLAPWLNTDQLIRKYMMIANDFSQKSRVEKHLRFLKLSQPFMPVEKATGLVIAPESYQRYNTLAAAIEALDVEAALALYKKFRPLVLQVFDEFSYPEGYSPEDVLIRAAAEIVSAPVIDGQITLVKSSVQYKFADPALEALNPVHKQMLRMGPENTRIIQNKIRSLVEGLAGLKE
jgi:hypothetical protein